MSVFISLLCMWKFLFGSRLKTLELKLVRHMVIWDNLFCESLVHRIGAKLVSNWKQNMLYSKTCEKDKEDIYESQKGYLFYQAMSSCHRCMYVREDPMKFKFEGLQMRKWNIPIDRAWRVDEKNRVIFMFTPKDMIIKMLLKMVHFFNFLLITKKFVTVWAKCFRAPRRSYWVLSENGVSNRLWSYL